MEKSCYEIRVLLCSMENHVLDDYDSPNLDGQTCNLGLLRDAAVRAGSFLLFLFTWQMLV